MLINQDIVGDDYWLLSQKEKDRISSLIEETLKLYTESEGNDLRLFNIIVPCYLFTKEGDEILRNILIRNIESVDKIIHELALILLENAIVIKVIRKKSLKVFFLIMLSPYQILSLQES